MVDVKQNETYRLKDGTYVLVKEVTYYNNISTVTTYSIGDTAVVSSNSYNNNVAYIVVAGPCTHMQDTKKTVTRNVWDIKQFDTAVDSNADKDWRDAFVEAGIITNSMKTEESDADAIRIRNNGMCTKYNTLMKYIVSFEGGGFWLQHKGLYFVTKGTGSDPQATYQNAKNFIKFYELHK